MHKNGDCFDEDFVSPDDVARVMPYVETVEDKNNSDRSRVFVHFDNNDIYELKLEKLVNNKTYTNFYER